MIVLHLQQVIQISPSSKAEQVTVLSVNSFVGLAIIFYSKHVESKDIIMKLFKMSGMQPIVKHTNFTSPCNVNNFDGMENDGGWLGKKSVRTFHLYYKNPVSVLYDYLWSPSLACSFPDRICYWLSKQRINQLNNAPSAWNNRSYRIREQIKIQIWKRYRTSLSFLVK